MRRSKPTRERDRTSSNAAGSATRERLLRAAERLVARSGIDGVSTREILLAAKADSAAIHYHFGSKNELMAAVFQRRVHVLADGVDQLLAERAASGRALTPGDLAEALVRPVAAMAGDSRGGGRHYLGFLVALLNYRPLAHLRSKDTPWTDRLLAAYEQISPTLSAEERRRRVGFAANVVIGAMSESPMREWFDEAGAGRAADLEESLLAFLTFGLAPGPAAQARVAEHCQSTG